MAGTIAGSASFLGGLNGTWSFQFTSDMAGLSLQSIVLDLSPTDLRFDSAAGGFGSGTFKDVGGFAGTDTTTGLSGISATGASLDGGTILTFDFTDFQSGSFFRFSSDVDHPDPALLIIQDCSGKSGLALVACNAANLARTATNDARLLAAQTVGPNQMAGARVTFNFGGEGYDTQTISGTFDPRSPGDGLISSADVSTPEPASVATFGAGLGILLALAARRRRDNHSPIVMVPICTVRQQSEPRQ
jgi:MYXO-CTERM domain-containing protein